MSAAERKVRERYPDAECLQYPALEVTHVWANVGGKRSIIGRGDNKRTAWNEAAKYVDALDALPESQS